MPQPALFVYGTLRDPDILAAVIGRNPAAVEPAALVGYRAAVYPGRTYPGLAAAPGARAAGLLLTGLDARELALLDAFEAEEYRRAAVTVATAEGDRAAEVYLPVVPIAPDAADWTLDEWAARHKAGMLANARRLRSQVR